MRCDLAVREIVRKPQNYRRATLRTELPKDPLKSVDALLQIEFTVKSKWRRSLIERGLIHPHPRLPLVECRVFLY